MTYNTQPIQYRQQVIIETGTKDTHLEEYKPMSLQPTEKENLPTKSDKTTKILETGEKIVDKLTKSEIVELTQVVGETIKNIMTVLVTSGGKPVAVILSVAVLLVATSILIATVKSSPTQINQPVKNSLIK
ncbi:MAG: hypothetical protein ACKO3K_01690 [Cuspidothrix sp.]